jgi:hypothetical protein
LRELAIFRNRLAFIALSWSSVLIRWWERAINSSMSIRIMGNISVVVWISLWIVRVMGWVAVVGILVASQKEEGEEGD